MVGRRARACADFQVPQREAMDSLRDTWLSELDYVPPGNGNQNVGYTVGEVATAAMSASSATPTEKKAQIAQAIADTTSAVGGDG